MADFVTLRQRIDELIAQHGTLRATARVLMTDCGYLHRLRAGEKTEPGDQLLRRMGLREVSGYERTAPAVMEAAPAVPAAGGGEARYLCNKCGYSGPVQVGHQRPNGTGECNYMAVRIREVSLPAGVQGDGVSRPAMTPELDEVLQFLYGAGFLDDACFGEVPPGQPTYWWRSKLRKAVEAAFRQAPPSGSTGADAEGGAGAEEGDDHG